MLRWLSGLYTLLVFVPITIVLAIVKVEPVWIFVSSCLAIIPLAGLMGQATEHLASRVGEGIGGLLNASLGNAAELIIALAALREGFHGVVKASVTGSIIGNILLVLGVSMLAGGLRYERQRFNQTAAGMGASLLLLAAVGLVVPALFHVSAGSPGVQTERELSLEIAVILFVIYLLSLLFSLRTHKHLFQGEAVALRKEAVGRERAVWGTKRPAIMLMVVTVAIAVMSEFLVATVKPTAERFGMTQTFVGVILVALVGNAAEHSSAVIVAMKNKMDLSLGIAIGSSLQIALFVAPLLVFASYLFGNPLDLIFTPFEVAAVTISVMILGFVCMDGESHWMEGVMLVGVYLILAVAFYFLPSP
jgi:Ca2+:H+ antiporter